MSQTTSSEYSPNTAEGLTAFILKEKPYLIELERNVKETAYGEVEVRLVVRAGIVEKMSFIQSRTWLKKKDNEQQI